MSCHLVNCFNTELLNGDINIWLVFDIIELAFTVSISNCWNL